MSARFEHDRRAEIVVMLAQPFTTLEHGVALRLGKPVDNEAQRFPCGVRVQRLDCHHSADMPLLLDENDIRSLLTMPDLIAAMRPAMIEYSTGRARQPLRTVLELGENRSIFASMPASLHDPAAVGTKLVTVFPANHARGLPSHLATIVLLDPETGALMAILDGRYITEARTAAVSALSADVLARRDARILAILGSGVQARSHLQALKCVRALHEVRVWSPHESHRTAFAREMEPLAGVRITTAESPALAVQGADLIVTATASTTALIDAGDVSGGRTSARSAPAARVIESSAAGWSHSRGCSWIPASAPPPRRATSSSRRPRDSSGRTQSRESSGNCWLDA